MKRKFVWLVVSCLVVAALLMASCGGAEEEKKVVTPEKEKEEVVVVTPEEEKEEVVVVTPGVKKTWTGTKLDGTVVTKVLETPQWGGVLVECKISSTGPAAFDYTLATGAYSPNTYCYSELTMGDWARGPAGTEDHNWRYVQTVGEVMRVGDLCESWEFLDPDTVRFHVRPDVHWYILPGSAACELVGGRTVDAHDIEWSIKRYSQTPGGTEHYMSYNWNDMFEDVYCEDDMTVVMQCQPEQLFLVWDMYADHLFVYPHEVTEKYGDINDWRNTCGTGAFMLKEYVPASSITYVKNPNHWEHDPLRPENRLPYLDGMRVVYIADLATATAALRTSKVDFVTGIGWEDAESLRKSNPEIVALEYPSAGQSAIELRQDIAGAPWTDVRVRYALSMAIDRDAMIQDYYGGHAAKLIWPVPPVSPANMRFFTPLEEMSQKAQDMYSYNPEKARELLAEAGYADGFKVSMDISSTATVVDLLSIIKAYWEKIGVDLELRTREAAALLSMAGARTYQQGYYGGLHNNVPFRFSRELPGKIHNYGIVNDPYINATAYEFFAIWPDEDAMVEFWHESRIAEYMIETGYWITTPTANTNSFWQPWVLNYHGEIGVGYLSPYEIWRYVWLDVDMMKAKKLRR